MNTHLPTPDKNTLRRELRAMRRALAPAQQRAAALNVARAVTRARLLAPKRRIAFFLPNDGELDLLPLLNRALWLRVACYLPVLPRARQKRMRFARVGADADYRENRFRILEPVGTRRVRGQDLEVIFVPLVGFDDEGIRVGMGGGFYDATLAFRRHRRTWRRPLLIGVAFDCQRVSAVPREPWDMPLDGVVTESGLRCFRPQPVKKP